MEKINLGGKASMPVPPLAIGCMRITGLSEEGLDKHISGCLDMGLNFFDHADIYGGGQCETLFGKSVKRLGLKREDLIVQSKCGIVPGKMFDFSKEHILSSVDGILQRLDMDYLDLLLLHRPDALMEPEEVAEAFDVLESSGKVKNFGVSNQHPGQMELLKKYVKQDLVVNQLQFSVPFSNMIASGLEVNMLTDGAYSRDGYVLDYCRLNDITIQAWSPFQFGYFEGNYIGNEEKFPELNKVLNELSEKYDATPTGIATAWINRHPAKIQTIAGSTKLSRIEEMKKGCEIKLTKEDWYKLYLSAGHILP